MVDDDQPRWLLTFAGGPPTVASGFHPLAAEWSNIAERERRVGVPAGQPILLSPRLIDYRLGDYFRDAFNGDQRTTALTYATEMRTWFSFLDTRSVAWHEAERADIRAYQQWRVYDPENPRRVSAATWNKGWAAMRHFYGWATRHHWVQTSPVEERHRLRDPRSVGGYREKNARQSRDRWISPLDYSMWRDVGFRGYTARRTSAGRVIADLPDEASRSRNSVRNTAFTDYLLATGLRLAEGGTLLGLELPAHVDDEVPIVGKGGVRRHYRAMHRLGLDSVHQYVVGERRDAIRRAQHSRRYADIARLDVVEVVHGRAGQAIRLADGRVLTVPGLSAQERSRLFVAGDSGPEPAALWLTESGLPMPAATWAKVFDAANARVTLARAGAGVASPWVKVTPHSLRFTFALFVLLSAVRAVDEHRGLGTGTPWVIHNYSQAFEEVRDLLGHASTAITQQIYLEPVKGLRRSALLSSASLSQLWDDLAAGSPSVGFSR